MLRWLALLPLAGCFEHECGCLLLEQHFSITVIDSAGTPVPGLGKRTIRLSDGADVPAVSEYDSQGRYIVMSGRETWGALTTTRERFYFDVIGPQGGASFEFAAWTDDCHCSFNIDSPIEDTLVLQPGTP